MISKWIGRYDYIVPDNVGKIVDIDGVNGNDTYNPVICEHNETKILALRCETRNSDIFDSLNYHPSILFAKNDGDKWKISDDIKGFDMLEDPLYCQFNSGNDNGVIFGGVRAKLLSSGEFIVNTELYRGVSLETLERNPFAIIRGMKDERISQLPDGRFLLCKRPVDNKGMGRIAIYIINSLSDLVCIDSVKLLSVAEICGPYPDDWVGINNIYIMNDSTGVAWVGLLGHIGSFDENRHKHYAATTYKIKLDDLINGKSEGMVPNVIVTRSCFEDGPAKNNEIADVVFPGSLEKLDGNRYRLWAGLSDTRIGVLDVSDPFGFEK